MELHKYNICYLTSIKNYDTFNSHSISYINDKYKNFKFRKYNKVF